MYQADGYNLLLGLNKGQYAKTDTYWAHAPLSPGERADMLLITDRSVGVIYGSFSKISNTLKI